MNIYTIFDRKSHTYGTLFTQHNDEVAQRYFQHLCSLPANEIIREDVELYRVGHFDPDTGILSEPEHTFICHYVYTENMRELIKAEIYQELLKDMKDMEAKHER